MLYDRDFKKLTDLEKVSWDKAEAELRMGDKYGVTIKQMFKYHRDLPIAALHYKQLFPNNYLNPGELDNVSNLTNTLIKFKDLLNNSATERDILDFIKNQKAYFIIASILDNYSFGHHGTFLFKEFEFPPNHVIDFLIVGKNSGGYEFIFVELENAVGQITTKEGEFGTTIRKGIKQIYDWEAWLEANYSNLKLVYNKYLGEIESLPNEFYELDKTRLHFVVIAGRRKDFNKKTNQLRRKMVKSNNVSILHYDNILDCTERLLQRKNFK